MIAAALLGAGFIVGLLAIIADPVRSKTAKGLMVLALVAGLGGCVVLYRWGQATEERSKAAPAPVAAGSASSSGAASTEATRPFLLNCHENAILPTDRAVALVIVRPNGAEPVYLEQPERLPPEVAGAPAIGCTLTSRNDQSWRRLHFGGEALDGVDAPGRPHPLYVRANSLGAREARTFYIVSNFPKRITIKFETAAEHGPQSARIPKAIEVSPERLRLEPRVGRQGAKPIGAAP